MSFSKSSAGVECLSPRVRVGHTPASLKSIFKCHPGEGDVCLVQINADFHKPMEFLPHVLNLLSEMGSLCL